MGREVAGPEDSEENIRAGYLRFKELIDFLPETIFEIDKEGWLVYVNQNAFSMFGYDPEDFRQGMHGLSIIAPKTGKRRSKT